MKFSDADLLAMFFLCIWGWIFGIGGMIKAFIDNDSTLGFPSFWLVMIVFWMTLIIVREASGKRTVPDSNASNSP